MIGKQFGEYVVEEELGSGGMGTVYKARQVDLDRPVALKVLAKTLTDDASFVQRFLREARAVAQLNHARIVHIYDSGQQDGTYYYVMELVDGESLDQRIARKKRLSWKEAVRIVAHVCRALQAAHGAGIIHRDIKPANIVIDKEGLPKVMDFGIALDLTAERLTRTGGIIGTPEYMSPEQAGAKTITLQSDIYSLGIVFYEMLTGTVPFQHENRLIILQQHQHEAPRAPSDLAPEIPAPLERMVLKMLAKDPADRYATCAAVVADLRSLVRTATGGSPTTGTGLQAGVTVPPTGTGAVPRPTTMHTVQRLVGRGGAAAGEVGAALVEVVRPYRIPLAAVAVLAVGLAVYRSRTPCSRPLVEVPTLEQSPVPFPIAHSYMIELYAAKRHCYQEKFLAKPRGTPMTLTLANGAILTGADGRREDAGVVLRVPRVRGEVRLPDSAVTPGSLKAYTPAAFKSQGDTWARRYYIQWKNNNPAHGGMLEGGGLPLLGLRRMLEQGQRDLPPPPEIRSRAELRQVAKRWRAVEAAREAGDDATAAVAGYEEAVRLLMASTKPPR